MSKYLYQPVTSEGHGVHGRPHGSLRSAQAVVDELRLRWPDAEVERVRDLGDGRRRYWLKRNGKWVAQ